MHTSIRSARALPTEFGLGVRVVDEFGSSNFAMLGGAPMVTGSFRLVQLLGWAEAIRTAIDCLEAQHFNGETIGELDQAANSLSYLLGQVESMIDESKNHHATIVELISINQPDLVQQYLASFSKAVGLGEV